MKIVSSKKQTLKSVKAEHTAFRARVGIALSELKYRAARAVATVAPADPQGKLNGMTIVELLTMVRMAKSTQERVVLRAVGQELIIDLEKIPDVNISALMA